MLAIQVIAGRLPALRTYWRSACAKIVAHPRVMYCTPLPRLPAAQARQGLGIGSASFEPTCLDRYHKSLASCEAAAGWLLRYKGQLDAFRENGAGGVVCGVASCLPEDSEEGWGIERRAGKGEMGDGGLGFTRHLTGWRLALA
jgi:hypothetical protein